MELMKRKDVPVELTWDLSALYQDEAQWKAAVEKLRQLAEDIEKTYKGKLSTAANIHACLDQYRTWKEIDDWAGSYSGLASEVDYTDAALQERAEAMGRLEAQMYSRLSFIESEMLAQPEEVLREAAAQGGPNQPFLEDLLYQ